MKIQVRSQPWIDLWSLKNKLVLNWYLHELHFPLYELQLLHVGQFAGDEGQLDGGSHARHIHGCTLVRRNQKGLWSQYHEED